MYSLCCMKQMFTISLLLLALSVCAQKGKITGKVISSKNGEPLVGATVTIESLNKATQTDQNGYFSFSGLSDGSYPVLCTYVSYASKKVPAVVVKSGAVVNIDIVMIPAGEMEAVVVKTTGGNKKPVETVSALLLAQKNSASVSDGISAESIRRLPDRNTGEVLRRVSGASLQEDKFAIVRGLNERYNAAYINGSPLPSSESDRKAFAFDIFPSNMIDNLIIYKTATPDMPAEFAGGQIAITTKGIPSENFQTITLGMGFNTVTTGRERKYYFGQPAKGGQWEFLGIDNNRGLPSSFPDVNTFKSLDINSRNRYAAQFPQKDWGYQIKQAAPNTNFQFTLGRNIQRKGKDFFGFLLSASHIRSYNRVEGDRMFYTSELENLLQRVYQEESHSAQTLVGLIGNFSIKLNNNNSFSLKNLFSINSDDRVLTRKGQDDIIYEPNRFTRSHALWFTGNQIFTSQLIGEHYLPASKLKINWVAAYSAINRNIPALRRMVYDSSDGDQTYIAKLFDTNPVDNDNTAGLSFYSTTREKSNNIRIDLSRNIKLSDNIQSIFKAGFYYQKRDRVFNPRLLAFCNYNSSKFDQTLLSQAPNVIFRNGIGPQPGGKTGFTLKDITEIRDLYTAGTELFSYYAMADQRYGKKLRLIYGLRIEDFHQLLNAEFNQFTPIRLNTRKTDVLPSANLIFSLNTKQNIRVSYSKTLNRPEFRELAPFLFRDYTIKYAIFGDTSLRRALINNYDVRYEFYPGKAQLISFSGFYKQFTDPIELISVPNQDKTLSYRNTPSAYILGAECEIRIHPAQMFNITGSSFLDNLTVFSNLTLIRSRVNLNVTDSLNYYFRAGRVMQGQSPYVINAGMTYQNEDKNISSTLSVNRYGQRIFLASNGDATQNGLLIEPNLWENGRTQIDFQLTKSFPEDNIELRLNVKDILAQKLYFFEDINSNKKFDRGTDLTRSSATFGRVISFTFSYKF